MRLLVVVASSRAGLGSCVQETLIPEGYMCHLGVQACTDLWPLRDLVMAFESNPAAVVVAVHLCAAADLTLGLRLSLARV